MFTFLRKNFFWIFWLTAWLLLEVLKFFPATIEKYYSQTLYPFIGIGLRGFFGWIPFSVGDLAIGLLILYLLLQVVRLPGRIRRATNKWMVCMAAARGLAKGLLVGYVLFFALWGLNYYRQGSTLLLGIEPKPYTVADLDTLLHTLHQRLWDFQRDSAKVEAAKTSQRNRLSLEAMEAYRRAAKKYPFMAFQKGSLKPNLIGPWQGYTGYSGYFLPFTGEANVNFYVPNFSLPYTVCHEMAHQLGFGSESEANLIGYLACKHSHNPAFRYSAYSSLQFYALLDLLPRDTLLFRQYQNDVPPLLYQDREKNQRYFERYRNPFQPALNNAYHLYLLGTNQPEGLQSYNYVVAWLIAFAQRNGWEAI